MVKPIILCVDDEKDNVEALERLLRKKYQVLKALSGGEALNILKSHPGEIHVILTDQRMPEMTGVEFLEQTLESHPETLRMLLTGYTDLESVITAVNKGQIYRYLTKPWDPIDLLHTIDQAVERYDIGKELKDKNRKLSVALEELKTLDSAKSNFMILINHELKTPLTSILNFGALLSETQLNNDQKTYLQRINTSADRLKTLIDDVLLIMKAETNQLKLDLQKMTISSFDSLISDEFKKVINQKSLTVQERLVAQEFRVDRRLFYQVVQRIIHNAFKFANANSVVKIESETKDGRTLFSITNEGPSISEQVVQKILQPFFINENVMNHTAGVGLGLTICESILKLHNSNLKIENVNNGVRVSFEL